MLSRRPFSRRSLLKSTLALCAGGALDAPSPASAQADATGRPLVLLVPFAPGGAADLFGRQVADRLRARLGQPVLVENRPGANTAVAARALVAAPDDGHTMMLVAASTMVLNPLLMKQPGYAPHADLRVLSLLADLPLVMVVPAALPVADLDAFRRYARAHDGQLNFASVGVGSTMHLTAELFAQHAGVRMTHVPYKGSVSAMTDLTENRVQVMFDAPSSSLPHVAAGKLRALAVTTRQRLAALPDVPSIGESMSGFDTGLWYGIAVRRSTAGPAAARLKAALDTLAGDADLRARLEPAGFMLRKPVGQDGVDAFLAAEERQWSGLIRAKGIALD